MSGNVLILGASGRFGRHAAEAFWNAGWQVRVFDRATDNLPGAAMGVDVIINAWNPPYTEWERQVPDQTEQVIGAAKASGATVLIPGNIYVYGSGSGPRLDALTPKLARNPLGLVRRRMEEAYRAAGVPTIILRAGDFIDTEASGNWFESHIAAGARKGRFVAPGDPDAPHAWAYLPDMARAAVLLAERRAMLETFEEVLFPGYTLSLDEMRSISERILDREIRIRPFPWWMIRLASPFWPMGRKLLEMRYLWDMPHRLDGARLSELLPEFRLTDPLTAIARSLGAEQDVHPDQPMPRGRLGIAAE